MDFFQGTILPGNNVSDVVCTEDRIVMQMENQTGKGTMTAQRVFDGAYIMYNDFCMASCASTFQLTGRKAMLAIDHCRAGRIEMEWKPGIYTYLQEKELRIDNRESHNGHVLFPLEHYQGITIGFDMNVAERALQAVFPGFSVKLDDIQQKFVNGNKPYVLKEDTGIEHIFSELYHLPDKVRKEYIQLKVLELLLYLDALTISDSLEDRPYFYRSQVEKIKAVHDFIANEIGKHYTTETLAEMFSISPTALKKGFKEIYNDSLYAYLRRIRLNTAIKLLKTEPEKSIGEIASIVGYDNQGKFSAAFKSMMGVTPLEYRKSGIPYTNSTD